MKAPNECAPVARGAGGDADCFAGSDAMSITDPTDRGNGIVGYGTPPQRRMRDSAICGAMIAKWKLTPRELATLIACWSRARNLDDRLFRLLAERVAPNKACADHGYLMAFSSPRGVFRLVFARLEGWLPLDVVEDLAAVAAELAFGATIKVKPLRAGKAVQHAT